MYDEQIYKKYPFFKNNKLEELLDSLTKVISRKHIIQYACYLIREHKPFYYGILDLDNFKEVNDGYGHSTGDILLEKFATTLADYIGDDGLVGRYGGDEFIYIIQGNKSYDELHKYLRNLVSCKEVVRRKYECDEHDIFITATFGISHYPNDADQYDDLFLKADKALYRGKMKGRNCFIIYVDEKHKDIDISQKAKLSLPIIFDDITHVIESKKAFNNKILEMIRYLNYDILSAKDTFLLSNDMKVLYPVSYVSFENLTNDMIEKILDVNGFLAVSQRVEIEPYAREFFEKLREYDYYSFMISRISISHKNYGYLLVCEKTNTRVWQKDEMGLLKYFAKGIAYLYEKKEK